MPRLYPEPELLQQYEQAAPGSAERILKLAEGEAAHRHAMNAGLLAARQAESLARQRLARRGQTLAFCLAGFTLAGGLVVAALGRTIAGLGAVGAVSVALLIGLCVSPFCAARAARGDFDAIGKPAPELPPVEES